MRFHLPFPAITRLMAALVWLVNLSMFGGLALMFGRLRPTNSVPTAGSTPERPPAASATDGRQPTSRWPTPLPTYTLAPKPSPVPSRTPPSSSTPLPSPTPPPAPPPAAQIRGFQGHRQSRPLSCEARSAVDWAAYFGVEIDELEFLDRLPRGDNPDEGFVGEANGEWGQIPPNAYGVHARPVADLLRRYGVHARARRFMSWDELRAEIATGRPVIVWVTGHVEPGERTIYRLPDGRHTYVAPYEHTVIVTGYTESEVTVADGGRVYTRPLARFLESWAVLGNMAIIAGEIDG